jgi:PAS domain S-box-containing protein
VLTITGFEQSKIIGSFIWDYLSGEKASAFGRLYLKAKALLEPVHYDIVPAVTSSGKPTYQSGWLIPLVKDGEFDGMICTVEDVTEQKLAHDALFQAEQKYRSIFENAVEGIFQSSPEGRFVSINPAVVRIHGYDSIEDMMNAISNVETKQLYVNPEQRKEYIRLLKDRGRVENFEAEMYKKDGTRIWTSMNVRAASDDAGNILYFEGTIEDITRRKHSEEKLVRTVESLRCAVNTTIQTLAAAVETKDPYTAGHQRQATDLARMIAAEMGLSADTIEGIRMACSIHDIGKISIPTEILSKPTKLSDIEFSLIKTHSESGYNMLKDVESPRPLADIVLQHHERMDGSGYPKGLKGDEILTEARIIAVADVVEAISSHRPYRPAKGIDAALKEIEHNAGILYDREVVEVCLRLFREKGFKFE